MTGRAIVIGGGLHGTSTALHLVQKGLDVLVVEKNTVGRHASASMRGALASCAVILRKSRSPSRRWTVG